MDFETVINQVRKEGITIMPIYCVRARATTVSFVVTITNPGTFAETEFLEIPITALGDGVVLGTTVTTIIMVAHGRARAPKCWASR